DFGQTQHGNNNAYCHDDELSWLDWSLPAQERGRQLRDFVARMIALRKRYPLLRDNYFRHGHSPIADGVNTVLWFDERGVELQHDDWNNPVAQLLGLRRARMADDGNIELMMLLANGDNSVHRFTLPEPALAWRLLVHTR